MACSETNIPDSLDDTILIEYIPLPPIRGAVAQLGERDVRNVEVRGSIPLSSTKLH